MGLYFSPLDGVIPRPLRRSQRDFGPGWRDSFRRMIALLRLLRLWRRRSYERRLLAQFGERERRDLALTQSDVEREVSKPFWRG
ncbi:MAG: hypothetical protein ACREFD_17705 [Stellaceae bacterium]